MSRASLKRLKISNFKLNILLDITEAINENLSTHNLLLKFENILTTELNIGKIVVYIKNKKWECIHCAGIDQDLMTCLNVERDLACFTDIANITNISDNTLPQFKPFDVIIPVSHKDTPLAYVLIGDIDEEGEGVSPTIKHLHFIQTLTNIIIVAIENKRLYRETIQQEALKKELELASKMQAMLIPDKASLPKNDKLFVDSFYLPHFDVGGDYYDVVELSENEIGFCIADVSGKGISAALLMSNFQANLRALFTPDVSLTELIRKLNQIVLKNTKGEKFITLFIAKYCYKTKELVYINAGHNPPIMYNAKTATINFLKNGCVGLGMVDEIHEINKGYIKIPNTSKLICYTDGLVEVENKNNVEFGTEYIESCISKNDSIDKII
ncbi:MAG: hypothetical protein A2046_12950, partial [Bacteroidetes bacterium GWA2_30_7]